jgi:alpha-galactosidase
MRCEADVVNDPIVITEEKLCFHLHAVSSSYSFFVSPEGTLIHSHLGGSSHSAQPIPTAIADGGWNYGSATSQAQGQKEFPDLGNGDFGQPAIRIRHDGGSTVTTFKYSKYEIVQGKQGLPGLPATFGDPADATTLLVHLEDEIAQLSAILSYSVFPKHNAFVRSVSITNNSDAEVVVEAAASFSVDLAHAGEGRDMIQLSGDWARENQIIRRRIHHGQQG